MLQVKAMDTPFPTPAGLAAMADYRLFVRESNRIEGIKRDPTQQELIAHVELMWADPLTVDDVSKFVSAVAPGKELRRRHGMNVRVGGHVPPSGGPEIEAALGDVLARVQAGDHPYEVHQAYEHLHPFMDGNGRSGRAIWLWQMVNQHFTVAPLSMGFLHLWYYQSLAANGARAIRKADGETAAA